MSKSKNSKNRPEFNGKVIGGNIGGVALPIPGAPNKKPTPMPRAKVEAASGYQLCKFIGHVMPVSDYKQKIQKMEDMDNAGFDYVETQAIGGSEMVVVFKRRGN